MNIGNGIENLNQIFPAQASTKADPKATVTPQSQTSVNDRAQISEAGTRAAQSVSTSDVRLDKVASIQSALAAGTYQVPASEVAKKIISSLLGQE